MEEKVLWLKLPKDAKYRKVIVAEDGMIGIVYTEESKEQQNKKDTIAKVEIPKPKALAGGSVVYKKDDIPYWYCKIKGRDIFMHVYMEDLTENDLLYDSKTGKERVFSTDRQKKFKEYVLEALTNKPEEGFRWIPMYEPSLAPNGSVQFVEGEKPLLGLKCNEWNKMLKEYSPENESGRCSKTTYYLLLLRWLKDGIVTLEQLTDHSEEIGHYEDSVNSKDDFERTGERKFGGLYGFVGNTNKIIEDPFSTSGCSLVGGNFNNDGNKFPLAVLYHIDGPYYTYNHSVGLMELKK